MLLGRHHVGVLSLLLSIVSVNGLAFSIHRVPTKHQCLDTIAFRRWGMRCDRRMRFADQQSSAFSLGDVSPGVDSEDEMNELQMIQNELDGSIPKSAKKYEAFGGSTVQFAAMIDPKKMMISSQRL